MIMKLMKPSTTSHTEKKSEGFVALVSVIIIGAIAVAVVVSLLLFGISSVQSGEAVEQSARARYMADACAEYALEQLREDPSYAGEENLEIGSGSCEILPTETLSDGVVVIKSMGSDGDAVRKVRVVTNHLRPSVSVSIWEEVAEL